jgi:hypothetical protein
MILLLRPILPRFLMVNQLVANLLGEKKALLHGM